MLKPVLVGTSIALAVFTLPAVAQQRMPGAGTSSPQQAPMQAPTPGQKSTGAATQTLNLTQEEQHTVLQNVDKSAASGNSTMGLGALTEGASVPSGVKPQKFNNTVTTKIPKLKSYSYFTAENKVAIVEPNGSKIAAVLDQNAATAK